METNEEVMRCTFQELRGLLKKMPSYTNEGHVNAAQRGPIFEMYELDFATAKTLVHQLSCWMGQLRRECDKIFKGDECWIHQPLGSLQQRLLVDGRLAAGTRKAWPAKCEGLNQLFWIHDALEFPFLLFFIFLY